MAAEYRQRPGMGDHFDDEDLVMSSAQQRRNWRGILIALMVIVAVLAMIVTSVVLLTPPQPEELSDPYSDSVNGDRSGTDYYYNQRANDELWWRRRGMRTLRLSDLLSDSPNIKLFNGTWISGNEVFYVTGQGDLAIMEISAKATIDTTRQLVSKKTLQTLKGPLVSFELSADRNHVLIGHDAKKLHRYSKTARYTVYTVSTGQMTAVMLDDHPYSNATGPVDLQLQPYLLHAQWHETSAVTDGNVRAMALIAVYRYDVYYVPWSLNAATNAESNGTQTADAGDAARTAAPSAPNDNDGGDDDDAGNGTSATAVSWKPWPHGPVRKITASGSGDAVAVSGLVSNGVADYLYEMEILKRSPAVWPSTGRYLMYATFDDRRVGEYKYPVYMKGSRWRDRDEENEKNRRRQKLQRKRRRRRRRSKRNAKSDPETGAKTNDDASEYYLYPEIRTMRYPKANTPNPIVTLSVIVNLDQLSDPKVQPKIRTLTPPPMFQYTDDYYFTAVQWVNDGGHVVDDDEKSVGLAAEVCVVWLNRAQNTSVTTLCKSPMWMCQETQVINAVGAGGGGSAVGGGQAVGGGNARRRYRRNGAQKSPPSVPSTGGGRDDDDGRNRTSSGQEDRQRRRRQQQQQQRRMSQHQHNGKGHRGGNSRRRRAGDTGGNGHQRQAGRSRGGWVDASVGGAGGGVPSTGGGHAIASSEWWPEYRHHDEGENFVGDDGYAGGGGTGAGPAAALLVRKGWETGDKELTPRAPVFAADGQGYVSVAPVRDRPHDGGGDEEESGGVRLRRPSSRQHSRAPNANGGTSSAPIGRYYAQVVAVNITKKLLAPLTFGERDDSAGGSGSSDAVVKSWTVVRILTWDQRTDKIYFLAVPSGRGAPHHRHLYSIKFTSAMSSSAANANSRGTHHYQQQQQPVCLSCDVAGNYGQRERRETGGKQNRMNEARDDRLRQQRERWEHRKKEERDNKQEAVTAEEAELLQQRKRWQQQQKERQLHDTRRHCTYYDAQFSRDGSHYALICLGPSVPYVTLHKIVEDENDDDDSSSDEGIDDGIGSGSTDVNSQAPDTLKQPKVPFSKYEFVALLENNTRLQDKYTNRVLLPGTRTFQLRLSGGRKMTTSGGLHFNDPSAAADYYSSGGEQQNLSFRTRSDSDPLTVAQVRLYLPPGVYDPEADPRPEFMSNHIGNLDSSAGKESNKETKTSGVGSSASKNFHQRQRRHSSPPNYDNNKKSDDGSKRQRRQHKRLHQGRQKKLYPMLVVVNSDPGSQAITDRFIDRLSYTTGLLCSGSSASAVGSDGRYGNNEWSRRRPRRRRDRRSPTTRYYSSTHYDDDSYDYDLGDSLEVGDSGYVVAVIDPGRGTWARGYESLLALNYGDSSDRGSSSSYAGGLLGTTDLRDQLEAVEYLLSSATGDNSKGIEHGYYSDDRLRGGRGSRDYSRWFSSPSQANRRYYSDDDDDGDDDYYDDNDDYDGDNDKYGNEDYYYYYYSNSGDNGDYGGGENDYYKDGGGKRNRRSSTHSSDVEPKFEALRLPYVDATRVALLGGGPTSPSTPPSIYGGYATARMALWQAANGGAPRAGTGGEMGYGGNKKGSVFIHSAFKCAISMAPVYSWRLYASAFAERYYGFYDGDDANTLTSYDHSDLIPFITPVNESSSPPSSIGKGINLLVVHGTADTTIHPQHSMMLVREIMQQQQKQHVPTDYGAVPGRRNSSASKGRINGGFAPWVGSIRISQLVMPDVDLSNSRMATDMENAFPGDYQHQLLRSIYGHVTRYLVNECFTGVGEGNRGRGMRMRGRRLRKRRRRRWRTGNRDQEKSDDNQQQQREEEHQQHQRSINDKGGSYTDDENSNVDDRNNGGRFRRHNIDSNQHVLEGKVKDGVIVVKLEHEKHDFDNSNKMHNASGTYTGSDISSENSRSISSSRSSSSISSKSGSIHMNDNKKQRRNEEDLDDKDDEDEEDDDNDDSDEEYDDRNDSDESDAEKENDN